jgi:hypothetical protein
MRERRQFEKQDPGHVRDEHYDLVSVIYHALQSAEHCERYQQDAWDADKEDLAQFFQDVENMNRRIMERARPFLQHWVNEEGVSPASQMHHRRNTEPKPLKEVKKSKEKTSTPDEGAGLGNMPRSDL